MVLVPKLLIFSRIFFCEPFPSATTETTEAIPIIIPSMVKKVRIRCAFMAKSAMLKASAKRSIVERQAGVFFCGVRSSACLIRASPSTSGILARSEIIFPSLISMIREAFLATFISCVTKIMVCPLAFSSRKIRITSMPLFLSKAPVGSSAKITSPPFINARAMETRCC